MGILVSENNNLYVGRMGLSVGYLWKGRHCVRTYRRHINFPHTEGQLQQRNWFVGMVRFASKATQALKLGLRQRAEEAQMTESNYFVLKNKQYFRLVDGQLNIDYSRLQIAEGNAVDVYFHAPRFLEDETVEVGFEKNKIALWASNDDRVYIYFYAPGLDEGYLSAPAARRNKVLKVRLPEHWSGEEVHLYGFVVDRDGRAANSTYIGVGRVNHYEARGRYVPLNKNWKDFVDIANEINADDTPVNHANTELPDIEKPVIDLFGDPPEVP